MSCVSARSGGVRVRAVRSRTSLAISVSTSRRFATGRTPARLARGLDVGVLRLGGLAMLEACCFVGAAGGVAGTVRMSAGAR